MNVMESYRWDGPFSEAFDPIENNIRSRAQSILTEAGAAGPLLPYEQARDVVAWHESHLQRQQVVSLAGVRFRKLFHLFNH